MRRKSIAVELTPLLDVLFIMIFVLLAQARAQVAEAEAAAGVDREQMIVLEEQNEALREENAALQERVAGLSDDSEALTAENEELHGEVDALSRRIITDDLVLENTEVVTVSVGADGVIRIEESGSTVSELYYNWNAPDFTKNKMLSALRDCLWDGTDKAAFVVFQYDSTTIHNAEYEMIESVLSAVKLEARQNDLTLGLLEIDTVQKG